MQNDTSLTDEEIEEIMSLSCENLRQPARADTGICRSKESDETEVITHQEPVQELSPDSLPDEDWQGIDFLDEEYGIQWNGHEPNMEELLEVPNTTHLNQEVQIPYEMRMNQKTVQQRQEAKVLKKSAQKH